jgi:hypothetical protein
MATVASECYKLLLTEAIGNLYEQEMVSLCTQIDAASPNY